MWQVDLHGWLGACEMGSGPGERRLRNAGMVFCQDETTFIVI